MTRHAGRSTPRIECRICVRDRTQDDGLCDHCRSFRRLQVAREALMMFMTDDQIDLLVEFLDAKAENEQL